jgi:DNA-binding PucR family transcriptional regulator
MESPAAQQYVADCLGPLLGISPPEKRRALLATLRELLAGGMFDVIGERLNVHPQTVRYRKRVIEKLLHIQLDSQDSRTNLSIALKLYEVQQAKGMGNDVSG